MTDSGRRIPDWLREGVVIVGSILLAFGIDARWELAQEQAEADALLEVLRADFVSTMAEAERVFANHHGGQEAAEALIALLEERTPTASDGPRIDRLFSIISVSGATFDPPLGTVQALIQSGRISLIEDPELAAMLTSWPADVEDLKTQEMRLGGAQASIEGALARANVRTDWLIATDHVGANFGDLPWTPGQTQAWAHLDSADVRRSLASVWLSLAFTARAAQRRVERSHAILAALEAHVD